MANAIVWQCRRTAQLCPELKEPGLLGLFQEKTGLILDPNLSGTKINWALEHIPAVREAASKGELACGTIDSYLLFRLTGGRVHATDYSNTSRTLLFNIRALRWDPQLLEILKVPAEILPQVMSSSTIFGRPTPLPFRRAGAGGAALPVTSRPPSSARPASKRGMVKNTHGTGSFLLMNIGDKAIRSEAGLSPPSPGALTGASPTPWRGASLLPAPLSVAARRYGDNQARFGDGAAGGSRWRFTAASAWPAFVGLGAPHWDPTPGVAHRHNPGRHGLTWRGPWWSHGLPDPRFARIVAARRGFPFRRAEGCTAEPVMDLLLQFQADIAGTVVRPPPRLLPPPSGAAYLAGLAAGVWPDCARRRWRTVARAPLSRPPDGQAQRAAPLPQLAAGGETARLG